MVVATVVAATTACTSEKASRKQPNVIIVLSDDQGLGGLGCQGNPYLKTPNIDNFYEESVHMTDFHVCPLSTPTRSSIITGRYPIRNGAWATFKGRDVIARNNKTIAEIFKAGGYNTSMFGKWHLGDNYPSRAIDCGFDYVVCHNSGGVGELSDYWGNTYFDDTYLVNNKPTQFTGYCTDVWFDEAQKYIDKHKDDEKPFFMYLATNAPHSPHYVADEYSEPYSHLEDKGIIKDAGFYGQIANLDENFGKLTTYLKESGLEENTILIFMTDNGAPPQNNPWVCGYRGGKQSQLEGGHRVPFFIRWAKGGIGGADGKKDIAALVAHVDILPTLTSLCGVKMPKNNLQDGVDFSPVLLNKEWSSDGRSIFIHHRQASEAPFDVNKSVVLKDNWRLLDGDKLYNIDCDKEQTKNVAKRKPELVNQLLEENKAFIEATKKLYEYQNFLPSIIGTPHQDVITLTVQHAIGNGPGLWQSEQIAAGVRSVNDGYAVDFATDGHYRISVARWPRECQGTIWGVPAYNPKNWFNYETIHPEEVTIDIDGEKLVKSVTTDMKEAAFDVDMTKGQKFIKANFVENGNPFGAYYIYIEKI